MIEALLLLASATDAVEAERGFAAMAQREGQWTAFRGYAAPDGIMFVPQQVNAQEWLKDRADPPISVMWWPAKAWVSCDGETAVTTGPWVRGPAKLVGYFTTIWRRQADGRWTWLLDHGDVLQKPRSAPDQVEERSASCSGEPPRLQMVDHRWDAPAPRISHIHSDDNSLRVDWQVEASGERRLSVHLWDGATFREVLNDQVDAPKP